MAINKTISSTFTIVCVIALFLLTTSVARIANAANGIDPTRPLVGSKIATNTFVANKALILESIFHGSHGGNTHIVVISGKTMQVNDMIGDFRLVAVNDGSVVLRSSEKKLKLHIFSPQIIK